MILSFPVSNPISGVRIRTVVRGFFAVVGVMEAIIYNYITCEIIDVLAKRNRDFWPVGNNKNATEERIQFTDFIPIDYSSYKYEHITW